MAAAPPSTRSAARWRGRRRPSANPDRRTGPAMASVMSRTWKAIASTQARASWARPAPRVSPVTMPRAVGSHCGLPSPVRAGTKVTPPLSGTEAASGPDLGRLVDDAEPVAQPLDGGARDEGRALERVGDAGRCRHGVAEVPGAADREAVGGGRALGPGVGQREAASAVGDLDHAGLEAALPEERGLLVAQHARHGDAVEHGGAGAEIAQAGAAEAAGRGAHLGQGVGRHAEERTELGRPGPGLGVEEERAAGVGGIGGVGAAGGPAGQVPQHPGVDGAEGEVGVGGVEVEVALGEEPGGLGGAEVRIEHQAGPLTDRGQMTGLGQAAAEGGGAPVLPDDGPVVGGAGRAVEGDQGLALVGDADGGHRLAGLGQAGAHLGQGGPHGLPDLGGVVLDPAGAGEVLGQLPVGHVGDPGRLVEGQGAHAGRARIDGDDPGHGGATLTRRRVPSVGAGCRAAGQGNFWRTARDLHGWCSWFVDNGVTTVM